jgi:hypothetical protein
MNLKKSFVRLFSIGKKKINVVYGPEDDEGDDIPEGLEAFRGMSLRSIGKTNWASGPSTKAVPKKSGALTTNEIQPEQNRGK